MISREEFKDRITLHRQSVKLGLQRISDILVNRGDLHDIDKFEEAMFEDFYLNIPKFTNVSFGEIEWENAMESIKTMNNHYAVSPHHIQHYPNGINGVNLIDLLEMIVDWKSANNAYGDVKLSEALIIQKKRFGIDDQLYKIIVNTAKILGYLEEEDGK